MRLISALLTAAFASAAYAEPLTIDLPAGAAADRQTVIYACSDNRPVTAEYINAGSNSLAIVKLGDETVLMVTVLSGSGARHVGQQYEWWTKGDDATLSNLMQPDAKPVTCAKSG